MKLLKKFVLAATIAVAGSFTANAQYYQLANQISNLVSPALSGSGAYRGTVEVSGMAGIGTNRANFVGVSTTQGYRYNKWFYMGAGLGVEMAKSNIGNSENSAPNPSWRGRTTETKCMIPLFSDFRLYLGPEGGISAYVDLKLGAAWLVGSKNFSLTEGYMTNGAQFYLKPTVGVSIPMSVGDKKHAFNIGLSYQLLTSNNSRTIQGDNVALNNLGVTVGYEW